MSDSGYEFFKSSRAPKKTADPLKLVARDAARRAALAAYRERLKQERRAHPARPCPAVWAPLMGAHTRWVHEAMSDSGAGAAMPALAGVSGVAP